MNVSQALDFIFKVSRITVNDVLNLYCENVLSLKSTIAGRKHALEVSYQKHIKPLLGRYPVEDLTRKNARNCFIELEKLGYAVHNRCLTAVKSAFNYVIEFEDDFKLPSNPFMGIKK